MDEALHEIIESKAELDWHNQFGLFRIPSKARATMGRRDVSFARDAGFECAFVNVGGSTVRPSQRFVPGRAHVTEGMSSAEFEANLSRFHTWRQPAVRR
jgi:hypothetical protein